MSAASAAGPAAPPVSMLLLAYNQQRSIGAAIGAALAQTYPNLEIVISDDGSTDQTYSHIEAAVSRYDGPHRVLLNRNQVNLGIGAHINRMVALASGELLFIAAGDDLSLPQRCERVVAAWLAADRRPDLIASPLIDMDEHGGLHGVIVPTDLSSYRNAADWLARPPHVIGAAQAWTRRVFDRFGPLPGATMGEDLLMVLRAILSGGAISLTEPLVQYRRGGVSRRRQAMNAAEVVARLLKNNRSALVELRQMLADARLAGQWDAVGQALTMRLAREQFIRSIFAARRLSVRLGIVARATEVPLAARLRLLVYAAFPGLLAPFFALKRWRAARRK